MLKRKILSYSLYILCLIILLVIIIIDVFSAVGILTAAKLIFSAFVFILVFAAAIINISCLQSREDKIKAVKFSLWILFVFYSVNLAMLLFFDMTYGRQAIHNFSSDISYRAYLRTNTNFIPFKGIIDYFGNIGKNYFGNFVVNILGNLAAFAPMGFFIPALFTKINSLKKFALIIISTVIFVELTQFITKTGICDIDDVILNSTGALIIYFILQTKFIKSILNKIYIIY